MTQIAAFFNYLKRTGKNLFSGHTKVETVQSSYNRLDVIRNGKQYILNAPNVNYSFGSLHQVFSETFSQLNPDYDKIKKVLILGFGAGSVAHILQNENRCNGAITGVEIDKQVVDLAKKYFNLDTLKNLTLHIADAADFVENDTAFYNLVVIDLFIDFRTPEKFLASGFLQKVYNRLSPSGMVLYNFLLYDFESKQKAKVLEDNFRNLFSNTKVLTLSKHPGNRIFYGIK